MKTCAVRSCVNDSNKRPDLCFFNLPKDPFLREDWLEILGVRGNNNNLSNIAVCQAHFKEKDFKSGKKKDLKAHVVPVLNLGQRDPFDSDEDFQDFPYVSENDPEILEIQTEMFSINPQYTVKQEPVEEKPVQEPVPDPVRRILFYFEFFNLKILN
ncbi:hypothetical protein AVEN_150275-1 [Araneus ventricosus]|uniref:THAP-type domain-containing protein n=1 Tax=Araneus ventricosus TaxID=182803 RepID=A0A4Y2J3D1_ARAVE|nr:hypothetical protein AVEN_150275-1 [Araneus ventricosus]